MIFGTSGAAFSVLTWSWLVTLDPMAKAESGFRFNAWLVVGVLLLALASGLMVAYNVIGSHVDADGWLHEPFAYIPLAWLSGLVGAVLVAVGVWRGRRQENLKTPTVR